MVPETFSAPFSHVPVGNLERLAPMNADPNRTKAIFLEAVENHAPDEWPDFLDSACADQPDLRRHVEVLLEAHREAGTVAHRDGNGQPTPLVGGPFADRLGM